MTVVDSDSLFAQGYDMTAMKHTDCDHCLGAAHTRRDFLRVGALSFMGIGLSDFLSFRSAQALALSPLRCRSSAGQRRSLLFWFGWRAESAISIVGM